MANVLTFEQFCDNFAWLTYIYDQNFVQNVQGFDTDRVYRFEICPEYGDYLFHDNCGDVVVSYNPENGKYHTGGFEYSRYNKTVAKIESYLSREYGMEF